MLIIDTNICDVGWVLFTAMCGMVAIGAGLIGYWYKRLNWLERIISVSGGLLMIYPEGYTDYIGLAVFVAMIAYQFLINRHRGGGQQAMQAGAQSSSGRSKVNTRKSNR